MAAPIEAFLADVYLAGSFEGTPAELRRLLDSGAPVDVRQATVLRVPDLPGGPSERQASMTLVPDEMLLVSAPHDPDAPTIHYNYYIVDLSLGPYQVFGEMAVLPGFDPGRALTRPGSSFVDLRNAELRISTSSGSLEQSYERLYVNRFAVERVVSDMELGFWFPGAAQELTAEP